MAVRIAIVGEFDEERKSHRETAEALGHLRDVTAVWIPTAQIDAHGERLAGVQGVVMAPGEPYARVDGAFAAIRFARERGVPLVGT